MSRLNHLTPRYVADRLTLMQYERRHPDAPWLTSDMVALLETWLRPTDRGIEWGSGRSTAWLAKHVAHVTTIEESAEWARRVDDMLRGAGLRERVDLNIVPVDKDEPTPASSRYVTIARDLAPQSLDFCLVDGDLRDHCARVSLPLLRPGGILIVDNVERYLPREPKSRSPNARSLADGCETTVWAAVYREISEWRYVWTSNGVSDTAFWVKPAA